MKSIQALREQRQQLAREARNQLEQKGDRWVRLKRVVTAPEGGKSLGEYEFEVDRNMQGSGRDRG